MSAHRDKELSQISRIGHVLHHGSFANPPQSFQICAGTEVLSGSRDQYNLDSVIYSRGRQRLFDLADDLPVKCIALVWPVKRNTGNRLIYRIKNLLIVRHAVAQSINAYRMASSGPIVSAESVYH